MVLKFYGTVSTTADVGPTAETHFNRKIAVRLPATISRR
jgi:hypothetical protein